MDAARIRRGNRWDAIPNLRKPKHTALARPNNNNNEDDLNNKGLEELSMPLRKESLHKKRKATTRETRRGRKPTKKLQGALSSCGNRCTDGDDHPPSGKTTKESSSKPRRKSTTDIIDHPTISLNDYMTKQRSLRGPKLEQWFQCSDHGVIHEKSCHNKHNDETVGTCSTEEYTYTSSSSDSNKSPPGDSRGVSITTSTKDDTSTIASPTPSESSNASKLDKLRGKMKKLREQAHKQIVQSRFDALQRTNSLQQEDSQRSLGINESVKYQKFDDDDDIYDESSHGPSAFTTTTRKNRRDRSPSNLEGSESSLESLSSHSSNGKSDSNMKIEIGPIHATWEKHGRFCYNKKVPKLDAPRRDSIPYNTTTTPPTSEKSLDSSFSSITPPPTSSKSLRVEQQALHSSLSSIESVTAGRKYASHIKIKKKRRNNRTVKKTSNPDGAATTEKKTSKQSVSPRGRSKTRSPLSLEVTRHRRNTSKKQVSKREARKKRPSVSSTASSSTSSRNTSSPTTSFNSARSSLLADIQKRRSEDEIGVISPRPVRSSSLRSVLLEQIEDRNGTPPKYADQSSPASSLSAMSSLLVAIQNQSRVATLKPVATTRPSPIRMEIKKPKHSEKCGHPYRPTRSVATRALPTRPSFLADIEKQTGRTNLDPVAVIGIQNSGVSNPKPDARPAFLADIEKPTRGDANRMFAKSSILDGIEQQRFEAKPKPVRPSFLSDIEKQRDGPSNLKPARPSFLADIEKRRDGGSNLKHAKPSFLADIEKQRGNGPNLKPARPSFLADIEKEGGGTNLKPARPSFLADIEKQGRETNRKPAQSSLLTEIEKKNGVANLKSVRVSFLGDIEKRRARADALLQDVAEKQAGANNAPSSAPERPSSLLAAMVREQGKANLKPARTPLLAEIQSGTSLRPVALRSILAVPSDTTALRRADHHYPSRKPTPESPISMMDELKMALAGPNLKPVAPRKVVEFKPNGDGSAALTNELSGALARRRNRYLGNAEESRKNHHHHQQRQHHYNLSSDTIAARSAAEASSPRRGNNNNSTPHRGSKKWLARKNTRRNSDTDLEQLNGGSSKIQWMPLHHPQQSPPETPRKPVLRDRSGAAAPEETSPPLREGGKSKNKSKNNRWAQRSFWKSAKEASPTKETETEGVARPSQPQTSGVKSSNEKDGGTNNDDATPSRSSSLGPIRRFVQRNRSSSIGKSKKLPNSRKPNRGRKKLVRSKSSKEREHEENNNNSSQASQSPSKRRLSRTSSNSSRDDNEGGKTPTSSRRRPAATTRTSWSSTTSCDNNNDGLATRGNPSTPKRRLSRSTSRKFEDWGKIEGEANVTKPMRRRSSRKSFEETTPTTTAKNDKDDDCRKSPPQNRRKVSRLIEAMAKEDDSYRKSSYEPKPVTINTNPPSPWRATDGHTGVGVAFGSTSRDDDDEETACRSPQQQNNQRQDASPIIGGARKTPQRSFLHRMTRYKENQANGKTKRHSTNKRLQSVGMCAGIE